jgi:hypothetical protein
VFWGQDGETRVRCQISGDALDDHFGGDGKDKLAVFRANGPAIKEEARRNILLVAWNRMGLFSYALATYSVKTISAGVPLPERRLVALDRTSAHARALAGIAVWDEGGVFCRWENEPREASLTWLSVSEPS